MGACAANFSPHSTQSHQLPNMIRKDEKKNGMTKIHRVPTGLTRHKVTTAIQNRTAPPEVLAARLYRRFCRQYNGSSNHASIA
eukprot:244132-Chlamydomonas_euryale.AAC.23